MRRGWYISGAGHVAFILAAFLAGPLASNRQSEAVVLSEVTILSEQELAALAPPGAAPRTQADAPEADPPEADEAPRAPPAVAATELAMPDPLEAPESPDAPDLAIDQPAPGAEVDEGVPTAPLPPSAIDGASVLPDQVAAPAPRIAPVPQPAPPPEAETGADLVEATAPVPEASPEQVREPDTPQAPEEASDRIVTEAEEAETNADASSRRPRARPSRSPLPAPDAVPRESGSAAALSDADAESRGAARPGPPLTAGEKEAFGLAVGRCWNVGSLSIGARATRVVVTFGLRRDGVPVVESIAMGAFEGGSEADARRAFEAARRAIIRCGREGFELPAEKYGRWREVEATFNAEGMQFR